LQRKNTLAYFAVASTAAKKVLSIGTWTKVAGVVSVLVPIKKNFFSSSLIVGQNKLEHLSLESFCWRV
jgi:hypothetical protein